ncbi:MAG: hypothetical protein JSV34_03635 [Candidatus Omnitrophota bacterium]|nr:MAG: hypothetical protein JSV34_03635 [Candidatus Omnitrophota bacterium]
METIFARQARKQKLREQQYNLIIGSLLGDAYLVKTTRGYAFRVNHGVRQKDYVDWKYKILKDFVNSPPRFTESCYYFRTISHPAFHCLREQFYSDRKKVVPRDLIETEMNSFIMAVWIMDDGSKDGRQLRINSQSFNRDENLFLQGVLYAKLGIKSTLNQDKGKYRLRVSNESMARLRNLVTPYIVPSMLYKLLP